MIHFFPDVIQYISNENSEYQTIIHTNKVEPIKA